MKFKKLIGYIDVDSSYIRLEIEGGNNDDSIGDQFWISPDGETMEITDYIDKDTIKEITNKFDGSSKKAFIGALMRMGII